MSFLGTIVLPVTSAWAQVTVPVTGEATTGEVFTGTFEITRFVVRQGELFARGVLTLTGETSGTIVRTVLIPIADISSQGVCQVLFLTLGPLHLELLGLIIDLEEVVLRITADPEGGILGDLLCAIADGFDLGNLTDVARLLNQLLQLLG